MRGLGTFTGGLMHLQAVEGDVFTLGASDGEGATRITSSLSGTQHTNRLLSYLFTDTNIQLHRLSSVSPLYLQHFSIIM